MVLLVLSDWHHAYQLSGLLSQLLSHFGLFTSNSYDFCSNSLNAPPKNVVQEGKIIWYLALKHRKFGKHLIFKNLILSSESELAVLVWEYKCNVVSRRLWNCPWTKENKNVCCLNIFDKWKNWGPFTNYSTILDSR